jgi:Helix-turn-helix domain of resolvase
MTEVTIEQFEIEHGIPIPLRLSEKMPVEKMAVGDSFFVPLTSDRTMSQLRTQVAGAITWYRQKTGKRFTVRSRGVEGGIRVWRIAVKALGGPPPKLSPVQQQEAIARRKAGERVVDIARSYDVTPATVYRIAAGPMGN